MSTQHNIQAAAALERGNRIRRARYLLKCEVRVLPPTQGRALVADMLRTKHEELRTLPVHQLLTGWLRFEDEDASSVLEAALIGLTRTVGELAPGQVDRLAALLYKPRAPRAFPVPEAGLKWCEACGGERPVSDFHKDRANLGGLGGKCFQCRNVKEPR